MGKLTLNWAKLKPEVKQVWQLSLPAILTQITTIAMQYIDSAMVGALGAAASAAIGLVVAMTWLYNGVLSAVLPVFPCRWHITSVPVRILMPGTSSGTV